MKLKKLDVRYREIFLEIVFEISVKLKKTENSVAEDIASALYEISYLRAREKLERTARWQNEKNIEEKNKRNFCMKNKNEFMNIKNKNCKGGLGTERLKGNNINSNIDINNNDNYNKDNTTDYNDKNKLKYLYKSIARCLSVCWKICGNILNKIKIEKIKLLKVSLTGHEQYLQSISNCENIDSHSLPTTDHAFHPDLLSVTDTDTVPHPAPDLDTDLDPDLDLDLGTDLDPLSLSYPRPNRSDLDPLTTSNSLSYPRPKMDSGSTAHPPPQQFNSKEFNLKQFNLKKFTSNPQNRQLVNYFLSCLDQSIFAPAISFSFIPPPKRK